VLDEREVRYVPPAVGSSTLLESKSWDWEVPERKIHVSAELFSYQEDLVQAEVGYDDREGGLLVYDENDAVLDLTLFGFDGDPAAARFFGRVQLDGIGQVIRARLNSAIPEELLTETRDGFDRKNDDYQVLKRDMEKWLAPHIEEERRKRAGGAEGLSDRTRKKHQEAFSQINSLYKKLLGDTTGLGAGTTHIRHLTTEEPIEFRWKTLLLSEGQTHSTHLLVNTGLIPTDELVSITSDTPAVVHVIDASVSVPSRTPENSAVVIGIKLEAVSKGEATITALWGENSSSMDVAVADEDVPDMPTGLAFYPDTVAIPDGERKRVKLYADLRLAESIDAIAVTSDNENIEASLSTDWEPVTANVVRGSVTVVGRGKGEEAFVSARGGTAEAIAAVQVVTKRNRPPDAGHFRGYKFQPIENRRVQAITDSEGYIIINLLDPTNAHYFGASSDDASARVEESAASQTLLADLVLGECLQQAVQEAYTRGKLAQRLDEVTDIQNYVSEQRFEIGAEIHKLFVTRPVVQTNAKRRS
jgi:hypothetical protein